MNIADKLTTIAENELKVYNAGKFALLDESKYMHPTISGAVISVNDVSPIEHNLGVKLSSDTITDFSGVNVTRCGKNLFDKDEASVRSNWVTHNGGYAVFKVFVGKGNTFTVSYQQDLVTGLACPYTQIICDLSNIDKNGRWIYHTANSGLINKKWTYTAIEDYIYVRSNVINESTLANFMQYIGNDLQIEIGATATEYEPYKQPQTATANADGTVEGLTSISPNITLFTDTDSVSINCQYYRDIDLYIDNLITDIALTGGE